jgi:hypothetical protein
MLTKEQKLKGKFRYEETSQRLIEENGVVSIWLGTANTEEDIIDYLEEDYSDIDPNFEGFSMDEEPSDFNFVINHWGLDFGFGSYDHDFFEYSFFEKTNDIEKMTSQIDIFLPSIKQKLIEQYGKILNKEYNVAFFLISYRYVPDVSYHSPEYNERKVKIDFLGTVLFDEKISLIHNY